MPWITAADYNFDMRKYLKNAYVAFLIYFISSAAFTAIGHFGFGIKGLYLLLPFVLGFWVGVSIILMFGEDDIL